MKERTIRELVDAPIPCAPVLAATAATTATTTQLRRQHGNRNPFQLGRELERPQKGIAAREDFGEPALPAHNGPAPATVVEISIVPTPRWPPRPEMGRPPLGLPLGTRTASTTNGGGERAEFRPGETVCFLHSDVHPPPPVPTS
ncbi:hypothetical protein LBMAG56_26000 [Verrucomicrobiota bacterium]|nr:hypothetical protein LBMAG56_26000 [Verrucomicrobiota bacterium]